LLGIGNGGGAGRIAYQPFGHLGKAEVTTPFLLATATIFVPPRDVNRIGVAEAIAALDDWVTRNYHRVDR
jgi:hypothetical protein